MIKEAFIFSSTNDLPLAVRSAEWMREHGWMATINSSVVAPRLIGRNVALRIAEVMAGSRADVVAKIDADTILTPEALEWLSGAAVTARGFRVVKHQWSGMWSASLEMIRLARGMIARGNPCNCPDAHVFFSVFRKLSGAETHPFLQLIPWIPGRPLPIKSAGITLPSKYRGEERLAHGRALFDQRSNLDSRIVLQ